MISVKFQKYPRSTRVRRWADDPKDINIYANLIIIVLLMPTDAISLIIAYLW